MALPDPIYEGPDWFSKHIPAWEFMLKELVGKCVDVLEIGSYEGRSARWLLDNVLTHRQARLTCIDTFDDPVRADHFEHNTGSSVDDLHGTSAYWLPRLIDESAKFDFIYIDGSHEAPDVLFDAVLSFEMLRSGGLLCFDDYRWDIGGRDGTVHAPKLAIDAFYSVNRERLEVLGVASQAWIRKL